MGICHSGIILNRMVGCTFLTCLSYWFVQQMSAKTKIRVSSEMAHFQILGMHAVAPNAAEARASRGPASSARLTISISMEGQPFISLVTHII